eukprot:TRINITY_DN5585_c0_g1_i2.p1 TRINITY_DN5585_c0_g1~~TRINITY_DN5585_c0_g1_i2.p1  ORF type:complete len:715 (+),score=215.86 TRINITY_DN5585_c0_g1_i2:75-2147(+)
MPVSGLEAKLRKEAAELGIDISKCGDAWDIATKIGQFRKEQKQSNAKQPPPRQLPPPAGGTAAGGGAVVGGPPGAAGAGAGPGAEERSATDEAATERCFAALRLVDAIVSVFATREPTEEADTTRGRVMRLIRPPERYAGTSKADVATPHGRRVAWRGLSLLLHSDRHRGANPSPSQLARLTFGFRVAESCYKDYGQAVLKLDKDLAVAVRDWNDAQERMREAAMAFYGLDDGPDEEPQPPEVFECDDIASSDGGMDEAVGMETAPPPPPPQPEQTAAELAAERRRQRQLKRARSAWGASGEVDGFFSGHSMADYWRGGGRKRPRKGSPGESDSGSPRRGKHPRKLGEAAELQALFGGGRPRDVFDGRVAPGAKRKKRPRRSASATAAAGVGEMLALLRGRRMSDYWAGREEDSDSESSSVPAAAAQGPAPAPTHVRIEVPPGSGPGRRLEVCAAGQLLTVTVPAGHDEGDTFMVRLPTREEAPSPAEPASAPKAKHPRRAPSSSSDGQPSGSGGGGGGGGSGVLGSPGAAPRSMEHGTGGPPVADEPQLSGWIAFEDHSDAGPSEDDVIDADRLIGRPLSHWLEDNSSFASFVTQLSTWQELKRDWDQDPESVRQWIEAECIVERFFDPRGAQRAALRPQRDPPRQPGAAAAAAERLIAAERSRRAQGIARMKAQLQGEPPGGADAAEC